MTSLNKINTKFIIIVAGFSILSLFVATLFTTSSAHGLSGNQFKAGRIIDDAIFYNSTSMSPQQIQNFLNSKVPNCDTNGTQAYGGTTRAAYGTSRGYPPPYTCLKDYSQEVPSIANSGSDLCKNSIVGGTKSAALIIADVAFACGINPQVLIVLLQKEQSLVTDDWPWSIQYRSATGYGCPDTAPCDSEYYGFFNQVYQAAKAFKRYEANPNSFNYKADRNNFVYYHPSLGACGGTNIFIENQATANLYIYTPYQPNAAALNNLYGTGDDCSSYGNRNFWRFFNDWFGLTQAPEFSATPVSSGSTINTSTMVEGDKAYITFNVRNTGNTTWQKATTFIGTDGPRDRGSAFNFGWSRPNRPAQLEQSTVEPGEIGTFRFWYRAPAFNGTFTEKFSVVLEGQGWTPYNGLFLKTKVVDPNYSAQVVGLASYKSPAGGIVNLSKLSPGEDAYVVAKIRNNGNKTWTKTGNSTRLATALPNGRSSAFNNGTWVSPSRLANMDETIVKPGQVATFKFWYRAPAIFGTHTENFTLVHEGKAWSNYFGFFLKTKVEQPSYSAKVVSMGSNINTTTMNGGERASITVKVRNTSNTTWKKSNTRIGTAEPIGRFSGFRDGTWPTANRAGQLLDETVAPGEVGTFRFWYRAAVPGTHNERFTIVIEGVTWIPYFGVFLKTTVLN